MKISLLPCNPSSTGGKVQFIAVPPIWIWFRLGELFAVKSRQPPFLPEGRRTSHISAGH